MSLSRKQPHLAELRHQVTLWRPTETANGSGGTDVSLINLGTAWAKAEAMSTSFGGNLGGRNSEAQTAFTLRYDAALIVGDLIEWEGSKYQISHLENLHSRNAYLICQAEKVNFEGVQYD